MQSAGNDKKSRDNVITYNIRASARLSITKVKMIVEKNMYWWMNVSNVLLIEQFYAIKILVIFESVKKKKANFSVVLLWAILRQILNTALIKKDTNAL